MKTPLAKPVFDEEMKNAALDALQNEKLVLGESVFRFEEEFAALHVNAVPMFADFNNLDV